MRGRQIHLLILALMIAVVGAACTVTERDAAPGSGATPTGDATEPSPTSGSYADPTPTETATPESDPSPTPSSTEDVRDLGPPSILLRTPGGDAQEGGLGAYCWDMGDGYGECVDTDVVNLPGSTIEAATGDTVEFDLTGLDTELETLRYAVYPAEGNVETEHEGWSNPVLPYQADDPLARGDLDLDERVSLELDQPPGEYAITLSLLGDRGDMQQGFLVRLVEPDRVK